MRRGGERSKGGDGGRGKGKLAWPKGLRGRGRASTVDIATACLLLRSQTTPSLSARGSAESLSQSASSCASSRHSNSRLAATKPTSRAKKECWLPSWRGHSGGCGSGGVRMFANCFCGRYEVVQRKARGTPRLVETETLLLALQPREDDQERPVLLLHFDERAFSQLRLRPRDSSCGGERADGCGADRMRKRLRAGEAAKLL